MKRKITRTTEAIRIELPSGEVEYIPGDTPVREIHAKYEGCSYIPVTLRATMKEVVFLNMAEVKEIDGCGTDTPDETEEEE